MIWPIITVSFIGSLNEHQDPNQVSVSREMRLLTEVEETPDITQRELSKQLGIALGLTNILLRNLAQKGYVRVAHASWKRRLYTLTPEGFSHRVRLMVTYIHQVLDHYQGVRQTLREQMEPLALNEESRVAIYGTGEFAELIYLGLKELSIEEIDVFELKSPPGRRFLGMPVRDLGTLQTESYDRVVIGHLKPSSSAISELQQRGVSSEQMVKFFSNGNSMGGL
jgi:DNA-binding MarR family transcriptional regulator